jgi:hypothetical protein
MGVARAVVAPLVDWLFYVGHLRIIGCPPSRGKAAVLVEGEARSGRQSLGPNPRETRLASNRRNAPRHELRSRSGVIVRQRALDEGAARLETRAPGCLRTAGVRGSNPLTSTCRLSAANSPSRQSGGNALTRSARKRPASHDADTVALNQSPSAKASTGQPQAHRRGDGEKTRSPRGNPPSPRRVPGWPEPRGGENGDSGRRRCASHPEKPERRGST